MIIGFSGKKQSGKNTAAYIYQLITVFKKELIIKDSEMIQCIKSILINGFPLSLKLTYDFEEHSFAEKLKQICSCLLDCPIESWENDSFKNQNLPQFWNTINAKLHTNRDFIKWLGTDVFRKYVGENFWVDIMFANYDESKSWIITDTRFPNEANAIKTKNGILIRINRDNIVDDEHSSETSLDNYTDFDYIINNNNDIEGLIREVYNVYKKINNEIK